ncbi:MAG: hypothetical protein KF708_04690 [Pirellulales bacterium]|nr:hypothetical protein [Pirellulales bacterium]
MTTSGRLRTIGFVVLFGGAFALTRVGQTRAEESTPEATTASIAPPKFVASFGEHGTEDGQFLSPIGLAFDRDDFLYVTDAQQNRVQRFTSEGKFLDKIDVGFFPSGIALDGEGLIYVAVMMDHKIRVYRRVPAMSEKSDVPSAYELVREWGGKGTAAGEFDQPGGLAFDRAGALVVCDQVNHRVQRFSPEGKFLNQWGEYGDKPGQFGAPQNPVNRVGGPCLTAVDPDGNIYTTEPTLGRIQKFQPDGTFLAAWGSNEVRDGAFGGNKTLVGPIALLFDRAGRLWVSATNHRVQLFTTEGQYLTGLGVTGEASAEPGRFDVPHTMAFNRAGLLYVADTLNQRVQRFAPRP